MLLENGGVYLCISKTTSCFLNKDSSNFVYESTGEDQAGCRKDSMSNPTLLQTAARFTVFVSVLLYYGCVECLKCSHFQGGALARHKTSHG